MGDITTPDRPTDTRRIIRRAEARRLTGLSATTLWRRERAGTFPRRVQLGTPHAVGYYLGEVLDWIESLPRAGEAVDQ